MKYIHFITSNNSRLEAKKRRNQRVIKHSFLHNEECAVAPCMAAVAAKSVDYGKILFKTTFETGLLNLCSELCNSATPN